MWNNSVKIKSFAISGKIWTALIYYFPNVVESLLNLFFRQFEGYDPSKHLDEDYFDELDKLETELNEQFGVFSVNENGEENSDAYYCIVCEKSFKTS